MFQDGIERIGENAYCNVDTKIFQSPRKYIGNICALNFGIRSVFSNKVRKWIVT
jgi:hypothetical protein